MNRQRIKHLLARAIAVAGVAAGLLIATAGADAGSIPGILVHEASAGAETGNGAK